MIDGHPGNGQASPAEGEQSESESSARPLTRREAREAERAASAGRARVAGPSVNAPHVGAEPARVHPDDPGRIDSDEAPQTHPGVHPDDEWDRLVTGEVQPLATQALDAGSRVSAPSSTEPFSQLFGALDRGHDDDPAMDGPQPPSANSNRPSTGGGGASSGKTRRPPSVTSRIVGVAGEVLITVGVLVLLFIGWRLWWEGLTLNAAQQNDATGLSEQWRSSAPPTNAGTSPPPTSSSSPVTPANFGEPVVMSGASLSEGQKFAVLYVPRFGADFKRTIAEGIDPKSVLNAGGAGHYGQTAMPGAVGNFAIAAHRDGWGSPFMKINELKLGDPIYVETQDGWYTYRYRSTEYVSPYGVGVLDPVPQVAGAEATDRIITLTSCNPLYIASERIIAYGVLESWQPREAGAPAEVASISAAG